MAIRNVRNFTVDLAGKSLGTFNKSEVTLGDLFTFENTVKMTLNDMLNDILEDLSRPAALRGLVWFMRFKAGDAVDISTIDFRPDDLVIEVVPEDPKESKESNGDSTPTLPDSGTSTE